LVALLGLHPLVRANPGCVEDQGIGKGPKGFRCKSVRIIECRPNLDYHGRMKSEPLLEYVLRNLDENKGRHAEIATATGVPYSTLAKIYQGVTPNPGVQSIQALADYFRAAKC